MVECYCIITMRYEYASARDVLANVITVVWQVPVDLFSDPFQAIGLAGQYIHIAGKFKVQQQGR